MSNTNDRKTSRMALPAPSLSVDFDVIATKSEMKMEASSLLRIIDEYLVDEWVGESGSWSDFVAKGINPVGDWDSQAKAYVSDSGSTSPVRHRSPTLPNIIAPIPSLTKLSSKSPVWFLSELDLDRKKRLPYHYVLASDFGVQVCYSMVVENRKDLWPLMRERARKGVFKCEVLRKEDAGDSRLRMCRLLMFHGGLIPAWSATDS